MENSAQATTTSRAVGVAQKKENIGRAHATVVPATVRIAGTDGSVCVNHQLLNYSIVFVKLNQRIGSLTQI
jgi:hypothetical protein